MITATFTDESILNFEINPTIQNDVPIIGLYQIDKIKRIEISGYESDHIKNHFMNLPRYNETNRLVYYGDIA